jgi:hypothetical protein
MFWWKIFLFRCKQVGHRHPRNPLHEATSHQCSLPAERQASISPSVYDQRPIALVTIKTVNIAPALLQSKTVVWLSTLCPEGDNFSAVPVIQITLLYFTMPNVRLQMHGTGITFYF